MGGSHKDRMNDYYPAKGRGSHPALLPPNPDSLGAFKLATEADCTHSVSHQHVHTTCIQPSNRKEASVFSTVPGKSRPFLIALLFLTFRRVFPSKASPSPCVHT